MKKFIIIGNMNAIANKEFFPYIKNNEIWLGQNAKGGTRKGNSMVFVNGNGEEKDVSSWWYTNIDCQRHNTQLDLYKRYNPDEYPKYDNYDAIEVSRSCEIPMDYDGVMGVPVSFLMFHCPTQFEIIWKGGDIDWAENECDFYTPPTKDDAFRYKKQDSTWRIQNPYLIDLKGNTKVVYQRMFIKKLA